jgi:hypothetical protein
MVTTKKLGGHTEAAGYYVLRKSIQRLEKERKQGKGGYINSTPVETGQGPRRVER